VEVKVTPVGDSSVYARTTTVSRPAMPASNQLFLLTTRTSTAAYQMRDVDDVTLRDEAGTAIAAYDFEPAVPGDVTNAAPIGTVADRSGLGHDLYTPAGRESNYLLWPVSGIEPAARRSAKQWLVDELLAARAAAGKPAPEIINNWRISDTPGRLAAWKSEGFTHGSAEAYWINPALATNENRVMSLVRRGSDPTRFAWADGSAWNQAYLGTEVRTNPPAASDYDDLITLQVLQGNRWFVVFTGMSNGHLGPSALDGDPVAMADFNADSIYAMCQAAAWFQSTASGLAGSTLTEEKYGDPAIGADTLYIRRDNALTTEAWFAGIKAAGTGSYAVSLPAPTGQVHSLKTGAITPVTNGTFALPLTTSAEPYYFRTDENRPDTVGGTYVWLPQAGTGNWSDPTKWDVGAPPPPDGKADVVLSNIVSGAESTIDAAWATNGALRSLTFDLGTKLDLKPVGIAGLKIGAGGLTVKGSANPGNLWSDYSPVNLEFTTNQAITTVGGRVLSIVSANFVSPPGMTLTLDLSSSGDLRFYGGSSAGFLGGMYLLRNVVALNGPAVYARLGATNALVVDDLYPTTLYLQYPTLLSNITATLPTPIVLAGSGSAGYSNRLSLVFPADMAAGSTQYVVNCTGGFASAVPLNPNWPGALVLYGSAGADLGRFGQVRVVFQGDGSRLTETGADSSHHFVVASQGYFVLDHPHAFGSNNCRRIALGYGATGSSGRPCAIKATSGNHVSGMIENGDSTAGSNEVRMVGLEGPGAVTFSGKIRVLSKDNPTLRTRMHFTAPPGGTATFSGPILDGDWDQDKAFAFQSPVIVSGGGTVVFAGTNTYGGPTVVTNGTTLLVNGTAGCGAGSNTLEVLAGSTLGGSGAVRSLATLLRSGACLSPGGTGAFGTLTVTNLTIEEGTTYRFDCGPTAGDLLSVQGGLTLPAALHVAVSRSGAGPSRSPVLIACTGPIVGTVSGWTSSYGIPILSGNTVVLQLESTLLIIR
jgi:autotransporter-associated beta strand protein